jgi:hypothetical protein
MEKSRIIVVSAICGVAMLLLLISQYTDLNAESNAVEKSREKFAYQVKGKTMLDLKRASCEKQKVGKDRKAHGKNPDTKGNQKPKGDADFYRVVVENNLFRSLGWQRPNREPQYTLIGTMIEPDGKDSKVLLIEQRSNQYYAVAVGEKVGDAMVKKIASNEVTLYKAGEMMTIRAEANAFLGGSGGEGGGRRSANRENRPNQNSEKRDSKQLNSSEMKRRLQNASPQERKRMLEKYRKTQGSKRQGEGKAKKGDKGKEDDDKDNGGKGEWADKGKGGDIQGKGEYRGK